MSSLKKELVAEKVARAEENAARVAAEEELLQTKGRLRLSTDKCYQHSQLLAQKATAKIRRAEIFFIVRLLGMTLSHSPTEIFST